MFLVEWDTTGSCCCIFFDLILTCLIATPHSFNKSRFFIDGLYKFFVGGCCIGMCISVCSCSLQHIILDSVQDLCYFLSQFR